MTVTHVPCRVFRYLAVALALATAFLTTPAAFAQVVSSGMTGIVRDDAGRPVAGANVTATHVPTGTTYTATSSATGRYNMRGMIVGGPYTVVVRADSFQPTQQTDVTTALASDIDVSFSITAADVVSLEAFTVTADVNALDAATTGASTVLTLDRIAFKPTTERSLADMISASPLVTLRSTFGDREESQITALGQNNRFNSIQIDGSRINDLFGLNGTGLASFFNPLSLEWVEQIVVQVAPYDVRQSGFTGASVNLVTKSGTNQFHGGTSYFFRGDELFGQAIQGYNPREHELTGAKVKPVLERTTWEAHFSGPIIRNKLFFFLGYEKFESTSAGRDPRFVTPAESQILSRLNQYSSAIDWGDPVTEQTSNTSEDEKIIAKLDWNISDAHRLSVRYLTAEGEVPQFGAFASGNVTVNAVAGGPVSTPTGHFYTQTREEKSIAAQLFSDWTPDFKTEIRFATTKQDQLTPLNSVAPQIMITSLSGTDLLNNRAITNGTYLVGTEQFRQGNVINVDSDQFFAAGEYFWRDVIFTFGAEREQTDFYNLFRQGSYGLVAFRNLDDFLNDRNAVITRNVYDPNVRPVADISDFATTGIFAQAKWDPTPRLTLTAGIRFEFAESDIKPAINTPFLQTTGFRNDGTPDGAETISPRVGFNLALDDERKLQLRGGIGHFLGRAPWVIFSNSFGQTGVGGFTLSSAANELPTSLSGYLALFDPSNPIGTGTDRPNLRREINWADSDIELPQVWRGNLGVDYKLSFLNSTVSAEIVHTKIDQALFITEENLRPISSPAADGRQRFAGSPFTQANALYPDFTNLFRISNTSAGESTYFAVQWDRPMRNKWGFTAAYVRGHATEAQAIGQTTAGGQWNRNVIFNQNTVEEGTADFEVKNRVQLSLRREFEFIRGWRTIASIYYEGRTGNPYSWVYSTDLNGDGRNDNDTVAVPSGLNDPRFDFSGMSTQQQANYIAFLDSSGLSAYAGGIAPKNAFTEPWMNKLDLHFEQIIPTGGPTRMKLFFDFVNFGSFISKDLFGYTEIAPSLSNDVFRKRFLGGATYGADGRIRPTYTATPNGFNIDNGMSRWRIQLGAKFEF